MKQSHVLDPLWIIKGIDEIDSEYYRYILLAANKKFRDNLESGDSSNFYEILFHSLNLNNLAVEGSMFDFGMNPVWDDPKLIKIREYLRTLYKLPEDLTDIFKNANHLFRRLLEDYLSEMLITTDDVKIYFNNKRIHTEKEIFIVLNTEGDLNYDIWKLKFDRRFKFGHKTTNLGSLKLDGLEPNALSDAIKKSEDPAYTKMDAGKNVLFAISKQDADHPKLSEMIANSIVFNRGIGTNYKFEANILNELHKLVSTEKVMPFTMKSWT